MPGDSRASRPRVVHLQRRPFPHQHSIERVFTLVRDALAGRYDVEVRLSSYPSKGLLPRLRAVLEARRIQGDVTHVVGDVHYLDLLLRRERSVLTVHDTEFLDRAAGLKASLYRWLWLRLPVWRAGLVTVPSEATRSDLLTLVRCDPGRIRVVPNPVGPEFLPAARPFPAAEPRVLLVGTWPSKNVPRAAAALAGLPVRVTVVGPLSPAQRRALDATGLDYENIDDADAATMVRCYRDSDLLLFPSLKEGFGIPVIEAQATGRPVVTSRLAPLPEVAGPDGACFVDPYDVASIRAGVCRVLEDADYRAALVAAGARNVERFRPGSIADGYAAVYDELLGRGRPA